MKYSDFDDNMKLEFWFIVCEISLIYFKYRTKLKDFNVLCKHIKSVLNNQPYNVKSLKSTVFFDINNFIVFNLYRQYGLSREVSSDLISDFFLEERWVDIYEIQAIINEETLPDGYSIIKTGVK